ncbi:MAG: type II toxin-antitoxin system VapC family toxin [Deltaproteobacteria bacterium]|nr:type II toxin-antitoxin system VapC family toxin [Deltaproteobacteria bacterium]
MKLVLDTNAYCLCDIGHDAALEAASQATTLLLPVIAYGELHYGFQHGAKLVRNLQRLDRFIEEFQVRIILVDLDVARNFGAIFARLRKKGRPIPTNDIWISACCMTVGGTLLTADHHFLDVDQINVTLLHE